MSNKNQLWRKWLGRTRPVEELSLTLRNTLNSMMEKALCRTSHEQTGKQVSLHLLFKVLMGYSTQKLKYSHLLTLKLLQTCMSFFLLLNTKEDILKIDWNQTVVWRTIDFHSTKSCTVVIQIILILGQSHQTFSVIFIIFYCCFYAVFMYRWPVKV